MIILILTMRCWGVVPRSTAAAGVFAGRPCCINFNARAGRVDRPIYTTKVESGSAELSATNKGSVPPFLEWPVRNLTLVATPRWVKGIPSSAAIPEAEVIPAQQWTEKSQCHPYYEFVSLPKPEKHQAWKKKESKFAYWSGTVMQN